MNAALSKSLRWGKEESGRWSRAAPLGLVVSIGLALSIAGIYVGRLWDREQQLSWFHERAEEHVEAIRLTVVSGLEALGSLRDFVATSPDVTREEFRSFTAGALARHPEIHAFSWNLMVPFAERTAVESAASEGGFPGFVFTERGAQGTLVPAGPRDDYVVVFYIEPYDGNQAALGFDIASETSRRQTILGARDSGLATVSERISLVQETSDDFGVLVLLPVYRFGAQPETAEDRRRLIRGFAVGVYRISEIIDRALKSVPAPKEDFMVYVFDRSAPPGKQRLFPRQSRRESPDNLEDTFLHARTVPVAGRNWVISIVPANPGALERTPLMSWVVLVTGLMFTTILTAYLRMVLNQRTKIEDKVRTRTLELQEVNQALKLNQDALRRAQAELEHRVEVRTAELQRSRENLTKEIAERRQAEQALIAWHRAIEASGNGILITDPHQPDNPTVYVNRAFVDITGYSAEETIGRNCRFLQGEDRDQPALAEIRAAVREKRAGSALLRNYRKDGSLFWNQVRIAPVRDLDGRFTHFIGVQSDVSELKRREEALRESETRFKDYAEAASDWLWEMDRDLRFTWVSDRFQEITGLPPRLTLGRTRWEVAGVDPDESETWRRHRADLDAHRPFRDFRFTRQDERGRTHHFRVNGKPLFGPDGGFSGFRGTGRNTTAEVEAERAQQASEARFRDIVTNSPSAIFLKDRDGRYLLVNRRFETWLGLTEHEIVGKSAYDLFPADLAETYEEQDRRIVEGGEVLEEETPVPFSDGQTHSVTVTKFPVHDTNGTITGVGTISTDVTEQRLAEAQLRQAQKMEAVGQLTGGVAHDFNNLLAVILGNLELVEEELPADEEPREMIRKAVQAAEKGAALTERLLAFSRTQALRPELVDVDDLVSGMLDLIRRSLGQSIEIEVLSEPGLWSCRVDPRQLESALLNLAINARDAMSEGGRLTIECSNARINDSGGQNAQLDPDDYVCLAVRDTGCGMSAALIEQAFDPFFTTKEVGKGSGLGLSMVYGFTRQSGGQVRIVSEVGKGTTVRLYLPSAPNHPIERGDQTTSGETSEGGGERILLVEDDPEVRHLVMTMLQRLGYDVDACGSGPAALSRLERSGGVDLLLTDVKLAGGFSGTQLASEAIRNLPKLPIIFMTGCVEDVTKGTDGRFHDFPMLQKPFRMSDIAQALRRSLQSGPH